MIKFALLLLLGNLVNRVSSSLIAVRSLKFIKVVLGASKDFWNCWANLKEVDHVRVIDQMKSAVYQNYLC